MNQEKIGKFIKDLRKKNNLTQKDLADKYNVTYQAVSRWENGKNMPDISLLKQISKDFNVSLEELFEGEKKKVKLSKWYILVILFIISILLGIVILNKESGDFNFKTISTVCNNFNISGSISYNDSKSAIYITNIKYCGGEDSNFYKYIECTLYESHDDLEKKISSYDYNGDKLILLEDFLEKVTFTVSDYKKDCKNHLENSLYLLINATKDNGDITTYKVPLKLLSTCEN